jgi:FkbM family methyltransferase
MGALLLLDQINVVDRHLLLRGAWEAAQVDFLSGLVRRHQRADEPLVLLDIGSHAALYPVVLSQRLTFDEIVAYEPVPANLAQLRANLWLNGLLSRVKVVEKAVSDREGTLEFIIGYEKNRGVSRIMDGTKTDHEEIIEVVATTIDGSSSYADSLIVCKIDVEGGELNVIEGMKETIARNRCIFQIENLSTRPISQLKELLEPLGCQWVHSIREDHYFIKV